MDAFPTIPSVRKFRLIFYMKTNSGIITFKKQNIYKCNKSFKSAMKSLHDNGFVLVRQQMTGNEYKLTDKGEVLALILQELKI